MKLSFNQIGFFVIALVIAWSVFRSPPSVDVRNMYFIQDYVDKFPGMKLGGCGASYKSVQTESCAIESYGESLSVINNRLLAEGWRLLPKGVRYAHSEFSACKKGVLLSINDDGSVRYFVVEKNSILCPA
jgi:hypothetical protein